MNREFATPRTRYTIAHEIASGGMATVYAARQAGPGGFSRLVAIKRPHTHLARNPEFRAMLLDEGRLAASISHANVVATLDVVDEEDELLLVMEYVPGLTLAQLQQRARASGAILPPWVACAILRDALLGLAAVHVARDPRGQPLGIVHRDISPQNVLVGHDGVARILDFGVAKAAGRLQVTREGQLKGKVAYMAPEQMQGHATARTDIYAASVVLWEALAGKRLFSGESDVETFSKVLTSVVEPPSRFGSVAPENGLDANAWARLDGVVLRGLARDESSRFASATEMVAALDRCLPPRPAADVSAWIEALPGPSAEGAPDTRPPSTLTNSGNDGVALRVLAAPGISAESRRAENAGAPARKALRRRAAVGVLAAAVAFGTLGSLLASSHRRPAAGAAQASRELGPVATAGESATAVAPPAFYEDAPVAASTSLPSATPPTERATPLPKSRVDRAKRAPVISRGVDTGHAIDARH